MIRRHTGLSAIAVCACLALSAACTKPPEPETSDDEGGETAATARPTLLFLGDSLTAGLGLAASQSAPALIEVKLRAAGKDYRVINAGRSGDTTAGGLARLDWYLRPEVNVRYLVIGLGSNDAMRGLPLEEISKNLREIVRRTRAFDPEIRVFLYQMRTFPNMGPRYTREYEKLFARVAQSEDLTLLPFPLQDVAGKPELNQDDGIHPTAEGTRIMADNIWQALSPHLR
jgi:acyl-CoA thioesterase-1